MVKFFTMYTDMGEKSPVTFTYHNFHFVAIFQKLLFHQHTWFLVNKWRKNDWQSWYFSAAGQKLKDYEFAFYEHVGNSSPTAYSEASLRGVVLGQGFFYLGMKRGFSKSGLFGWKSIRPAHPWHRFSSTVQQGIFLPESTFSTDSFFFYSAHKPSPPCVIPYINVCAHVEDLVVHVQVWWITETTKTPSMHDRLGSNNSSRLAFPGDSNLNFPWQKFQHSCKNRQKKRCGLSSGRSFIQMFYCTVNMKLTGLEIC